MQVDYFDNVCDYRITVNMSPENKMTEIPISTVDGPLNGIKNLWLFGIRLLSFTDNFNPFDINKQKNLDLKAIHGSWAMLDWNRQKFRWNLKIYKLYRIQDWKQNVAHLVFWYLYCFPNPQLAQYLSKIILQHAAPNLAIRWMQRWKLHCPLFDKTIHRVLVMKLFVLS